MIKKAYLSTIIFCVTLTLSLGAFPLRVQADPVNLISNPSLETASSNPSIPQSWQKGGSGTNTRVLTYPVTGIDGASAAKTDITAYTSGDAKWYFTQVPVIPGDTYTFKDMYLSTTTSYVTFRYTLASGAYMYPDLERNIPAAATWTQFQKNFTVPTNYPSAVQYVTMFHLIKSVGSLTIDAYSLTHVDTQAPSVSVTAPTGGSTISGTTTLTANASDDSGILGVQFFIDGVVIGAQDTAEPFSYDLDTTLLSNGTHSITARATDAANNSATSAPVSVTVNNVIILTTGTITIKKLVINNNGGTAVAGDFTLHLKQGSTDVSGSPVLGSESGTSFSLAPGTYTFSENSFTGYTQTGFTGDCDISGTITVAVGETKICTVTNDDIPPATGTITVTNIIVNDNGATKTLSDFPLFIDADNVASGSTTSVLTGTHTVSEITDPNYTRTISGDCDGNGTVSVSLSDNKSCVITNDDIAAVPPITTPNLVPNPSVETASSNPSIPQSWQKGGSGTNTRVLTYPVAGYDGVRAVKTEITSYTTGDAKWYFAVVPAQSGQQYYFSDFYMSNTTSYVTMQYQLQDGTFKYQDIIYGVPAAGTWTRAQTGFTIPTYTQPVVAMTVFHLIKSVGYISVDNYSLQQVPPPPSDPTNVIANPSVETVSVANTSLPYGWNKTSSAGITATFSYGTPAQDGLSGVTVSATAYTSGAGAKWYFQSVPVTPGDEYRFSDYYKGTADSFVAAQFQLADGTYQYLDLARLTPSASWKQVQDTFLIPANAISVTVLHGIKAVGTLSADNYTLRKLTNGAFAHGMVTLSFDDGLGSVYQNAIPILNSHNIKSTQFIVSTFFNEQPEYVTVQQMLNMNASGHEIGAHTRTHAHLTELSAAEAINEIVGSKSDLATLGATPDSTFAYPYGEYNDLVRQMVVDAGFIGARTVHSGYNTKNTDKFALRDQHVEVNTTSAQIISYIQTAMANNTWLILELHDCNNSGDQYSNTPATLQAVADYIAANSIPVVTTAEGIALMN